MNLITMDIVITLILYFKYSACEELPFISILTRILINFTENLDTSIYFSTNAYVHSGYFG